MVIFDAKADKCPCPRPAQGIHVPPGTTITLHAREVSAIHLSFGLANRSVHLDLVDPSGEVITTEGVSVAPTDFTTDAKGFSPDIVVSSHNQYLIMLRAQFLDKHMTGISYSMPLLFQ
jgi:hypothetical protein